MRMTRGTQDHLLVTIRKCLECASRLEGTLQQVADGFIWGVSLLVTLVQSSWLMVITSTRWVHLRIILDLISSHKPLAKKRERKNYWVGGLLERYKVPSKIKEINKILWTLVRSFSKFWSFSAIIRSNSSYSYSENATRWIILHSMPMGSKFQARDMYLKRAGRNHCYAAKR